MRKLQTKDVFAAMRIIKKANMREEIKPFIKLASEGSINIEDIGIEGILGLIETFVEKNAENAIYEVLAGPFEVKPDEVASMELNTLKENLEALAKENNLKVFFTSLVGLIGQN